MYDVSRLSVPSNISDLFTQVNKIHTHKTRSSSSGNLYILIYNIHKCLGSNSKSLSLNIYVNEQCSILKPGFDCKHKLLLLNYNNYPFNQMK